MSNPPSDQSVKLQTSVVQITEQIAEEALKNDVKRIVCIVMNNQGDISTLAAGCLNSDALGMLQVAGMMFVRRLSGAA